jgi:hypothetical protein
VTFTKLKTLSNHAIFISLARGLHQYYDHGGISMGRSYQAQLFEAFFFRLDLEDIGPLTLLTGEFFHEGTILGHITKERSNANLPQRPVHVETIEELQDMVLAYLLIQNIIDYYESGTAKEDGWYTQTPLQYCRAMKSILELDFDFSNIEQRWQDVELIAEGSRRLRIYCSMA